MNKKILIITILIILPMILAVETLGTFQEGFCVDLKQVCDNCTYVNITKVTYPNSTDAIKGQISMSKNVSEYNYTFCFTDVTGTYIYTTCGDSDGVYTCASVDFEITPTGTVFDTSQAIFYSMFIICMFFVFILTLYGALRIPWKNKRNSDGKVISVNELKYVKAILWYFLYYEAWFMSFLLYGMFTGFLGVGGVGNFFRVAYVIFKSLLFPITFGTIFFIIIIIVQDMKFQRAISRGFYIK